MDARSKSRRLAHFGFLVVLAIFFGCSQQNTTPPPPYTVPPPPGGTAQGLPYEDGVDRTTREYVEIDVFYATDRAPTGSLDAERAYGIERSPGGRLQLGMTTVAVPLRHEIGEVERPAWWRLELRPDPAKHLTVLRVELLPEDTFHSRLEGAVRETPRRELLVFVHGFNVTFTEAALRTAQIAHDLAPLDLVPMVYSWPSRGEIGLAGYRADATNIEWTVPHLEAFLASLLERSGAESIQLIAHSMGNVALTKALQRLAARGGEDTAPVFRHIVLTAPDIERETFAELAREIHRLGERTTLYASSGDRALKLSREINGGYPRAGDSEPEVVVVDGVDSIDVSGLDTSLLGHSYYGDHSSVLSDLFHLLRDGKGPDERAGLEPVDLEGRRYWAFVPSEPGL